MDFKMDFKKMQSLTQGMKQIKEEKKKLNGIEYQRAQAIIQQAYANIERNNYEEAFRLFKEAAGMGYSEAMCNVAIAYHKGSGVNKDLEEYFKWIHKAAEAGNAIGMFMTAVCYHEGDGVEKDPASCFAWLKKALETDEMALVNRFSKKKAGDMITLTGLQYLYGEGVLQNSKEGLKWLTKAAMNYENYFAIRCLGCLYAEGEIPDIPIDIDKALKYFEMIAKRGFPNPQYAAEDVHKLWILCAKKVKTAQNPKELEHYKSLQLKWCKKSAKLGDEEAKKELNHISKKSKISSYVLQKRKEKAEAGNIMTIINLGCYYLTEDDYETASYWLERACEDSRDGRSGAEYVYSIIYEEGLGVTQDKEQAAKYREEALKHNIQDITIGFIYESLGDLSKAKYYYEKELISREYMKKTIDGIYVSTVIDYFSHIMHWPSENGSILFENLLTNLDDAIRAQYRPGNKRPTVDGIYILMKDPWSKKKSSGCFVTTAVFCSFGESDDCYNLTAFRNFRDSWLRQQPDGERLIARYYQIAPSIVEHINLLPNAKEIYRGIWDKYLQPCLRCLEKAQYPKCKQIYIKMVESLEKMYG